MNNITKIGFYTPDTPDDPLKTLIAELERMRPHLSRALLVLPEAFNIGTGYSRQGDFAKDPRILSDLRERCTDFDIPSWLA